MATIPQRTFEPLPVGTYRAKIGAVAVEPGKFGGDQVVFRFDITTPGCEGRDVRGFCSATFTPASKLFRWVTAAFGGRAIPADYNLETDHLLDKEVELVLVQRPSDDGRVFNRIDAVLPVRTPATAARTAPAPAPAGVPAGVVTRPPQRPPLTAATAAGAAPQRGPVPVNVGHPGEPPDWPGWDAAVEPPAPAGPYDAELTF